MYNVAAIPVFLLLIFLSVLICHTKDVSGTSIFSALKDNHIHSLVKRAPNATAQIRPINGTAVPTQNELKEMLEKWGLLLENARTNSSTAKKVSSDKETRSWNNDNSNDNADKQPEEVLHENGYYSWQGYYSRLGSPGTEKNTQADIQNADDNGPKDRPLY